MSTRPAEKDNTMKSQMIMRSKMHGPIRIPTVTLHKYLSQDESLFYVHVTSGQSGT